MNFESIVVLGNSAFRGLYHREHGLAIELAKRGTNVYFVEEMPSLASISRQWLKRSGAPTYAGRPDRASGLPSNLTILTPPVVPTYFRSSYVPAVDRVLFRRWFEKATGRLDWSRTILVVTLPYWWGRFVDRTICPAGAIVYDWHDRLEVPSRNSMALRRMMFAEDRLLREADLVTCSARTMVPILSGRCDHASVQFLPNAVNSEFVGSTAPRLSPRTRKRVGYLGSLDSRWIDRELLMETAVRLETCDFEIIGPADRSVRRAFRRASNVRIAGYMNHGQALAFIRDCDVLLIPLRRTHISDAVNPLKLYEYCATGHPIVATRTQELEHYAGYVYLAGTHDEFIQSIRNALGEDTPERRQERIRFAASNTWSIRAAELVSFFDSLVAR